VRRFLGGVRKSRKTYVIPQMAPRNELCVYNPDIVTLERAIKERVLYVEDNNVWLPAPLPRANVFDRRLRSFETLLGRALPSTTPMSRDHFAESYQGRRRVIYQEAADTLKTIGVSPADAKIKAFVKAEKGKHGSAPRVIQPRSPRYNVEVGKFLKPAEGVMYKAIRRVYGEPTVMKGYNARQVASRLRSKWERFNTPVAVGLDAKRFDQHVSVQALRWEHRQWLKPFRNPAHKSELSRLLRWQLVNRGTGYCKDGKLRYRVAGKRMSGDMNTGSGNCLLMCAMVFGYLEHIGMGPKTASLVNNGDDCVVFMDKRDLPRFMPGLSQWFLEMGFRMTIEAPVYDFERIEFCQSHPLYDGSDYTMVRNLRAFDKDACCLVPIESEYTLREWLAAVGDAGMSLTGGIPVWQDFYSVYQRSAGALSSVKRRVGAGFLNQSAFETGMMMSAQGMERKYGEVSARARLGFWVAFGIVPDHQEALEAQYKLYPNITLDRSLVNHPILPCRGFQVAF